MDLRDRISRLITEGIDFALADNQLNLLVNEWLPTVYKDPKHTSVTEGCVTLFAPRGLGIYPIIKIAVGPDNAFFVKNATDASKPVECVNIPAVKNRIEDIMASIKIEAM